MCVCTTRSHILYACVVCANANSTQSAWPLVFFPVFFAAATLFLRFHSLLYFWLLLLLLFLFVLARALFFFCHFLEHLFHSVCSALFGWCSYQDQSTAHRHLRGLRAILVRCAWGAWGAEDSRTTHGRRCREWCFTSTKTSIRIKKVLPHRALAAQKKPIK